MAIFQQIQQWESPETDEQFEDMRMNDLQYASYMCAASIGDVLRGMANERWQSPASVNVYHLRTKVERTIHMLSRQNRFSRGFEALHGKDTLLGIINTLRLALTEENIDVLVFVY
jgi:hypothetical protein